jgi:ABC-type glutathione transport system ATPase component
MVFQSPEATLNPRQTVRRMLSRTVRALTDRRGAALRERVDELARMVHLDPGTVCWLDDPLLPDAVHLTGLGYSFDQAAGTRVRATGRALVGTAAVWPRPAS